MNDFVFNGKMIIRESRSKEMQTAEQILAVTNENLKRSEQDFSAARTELTATNRQLKDAQRQMETLQVQLSKSIYTAC